MNDDFIYRALPEVPRAFAESLYTNICSDVPSHSKRRAYVRLTGLRRSQVTLIALAVLLMVAWSQLRLLIRYVPVGDLWLVEFAKTTQENQPAIPFVPTPLPTYDWNSTLAPDELTFIVYFPSWIPEGFQAIEHPLDNSSSYEATIGFWSNAAGEKIRLYFVGRSGGMRPYAPQGMWEEVSVNGQPAIVIHGRFTTTSSENPQTPRKWDETLGLQVHWVIEKYVYTLETYGPYVSEQDLIRMAESATGIPIIYPTSTP
jgi:hypothetical protein